MKKFDLQSFSSYGREPLNIAYVEQAKYLLKLGNESQVNWVRLIKMLHYCIHYEIDRTELLDVLGNIVDTKELQDYCADLEDWKNACKTLELLARCENHKS